MVLSQRAIGFFVFPLFSRYKKKTEKNKTKGGGVGCPGLCYPEKRVVMGGLDHISRTIKRSFHNSRNIENDKDNQNHDSRRMKYLFLVSRKIILQNHASRLLWKSRFTRKKRSYFTFHGKKKGPITGHENTLYHPQKSLRYREVAFMLVGV